MQWARKTDSNHKAIVKALRKAHCSVFDASRVGQGFPDLVCGFLGRTFLCEIKSDKGKFTEDQVKFIDNWHGGETYILHTIDDVVTVLQAVQNWRR